MFLVERSHGTVDRRDYMKAYKRAYLQDPNNVAKHRAWAQSDAGREWKREYDRQRYLRLRGERLLAKAS